MVSEYTPSGVRRYVQALRYEEMSHDQLVSLTRARNMGSEQAREKLVLNNLLLVVKIAGEFLRRGLPLLDLIQEGNRGLIESMKTFDPDKGKISVYAGNEIRAHIQRALVTCNTHRVINLPPKSLININKIKEEEKRYRQEKGYKPSYSQIAQALNLEPLTVVSLSRDGILAQSSLDGMLDEDGEITSKDAPCYDLTPTQYAQKRTEVELLQLLLGKLGERNRDIMMRRYGLNGYAPQTLKQVARAVGVNDRRVLQIEAESISKMRRHAVQLGEI